MTAIRLLSFIICLISVSVIYAQNNVFFTYTYDNAGNRITRTYTIAKNTEITNPVSDSLLVEQANNDEISDSNSLSGKIGEYTINIYPNPVKESLVISLQGDIDQSVQSIWSLFEANGKLIANSSISTNENTIDLSTYKPGVYLLRVFVNNNFEEYKIVKQ